MSIPYEHKDIARAAIAYVEATNAYEAHMNGTAWNYLDREDRQYAESKQYDLECAVTNARSELWRTVERFTAQ